MSILFTGKETWDGGEYEMMIQLHDRSAATRRYSLSQLWSSPNIQGPYPRKDVEPDLQKKIQPSRIPLRGTAYGIAKFPSSNYCACFSHVMKPIDSDECWLGLCLPLGGLASIFPVGGYPFEGQQKTSHEAWIKVVDDWLREIAESIYASVRFNVAILGFEVPDVFALSRSIREGIPNERWDGILLSSGHELQWYPPTIYLAPATIDKNGSNS